MLKRFVYQDILLCFFIAGVAAGTVMANLLSKEVISQGGYFGTVFPNAALSGWQADMEFLFYIGRQRLLEMAFALLMAMTVYSFPCFCLMAAYYGFLPGIVLTILTCQKGLLGLPYYVVTIFPQCIVYLAVWYVLAMWACERSHKLRPASVLGLLVLVLVGILLEWFVNPYLIKILAF